MKKKIGVKDVDSFMQGMKFGAMAVLFLKIDFNELIRTSKEKPEIKRTETKEVKD